MLLLQSLDLSSLPSPLLSLVFQGPKIAGVPNTPQNIMSTPLVRAEHTDGSDITVPLLDPEAQPLGFESSANNDDM